MSRANNRKITITTHSNSQIVKARLASMAILLIITENCPEWQFLNRNYSNDVHDSLVL